MITRPHGQATKTTALYWVCLFVALGLYFFLLYVFDRSLFSPRPGRVVDEPDGFEQTILALLLGSDDTPLWLFARFAIIAPLLLINELTAVSFLQGLYLLLYSLPVVLWSPFGARRSVLQLVLLFIPVFISFRLAICIYAMAFCLMFIVDRRISPWAFLWYSFAVFLSSSTMFIFLLCFPLLVVRRMQDCSLLIKALLWLLYCVVVDQFLEKIIGLFTRSIDGEVLSTASEAGLDYSGSTGGFAMALLTGNPFFTAIVYGQYDRLLLLIPSVVGAMIIILGLWRANNMRVLTFVLILLASMLSEGVGSYSVGVVLFMVFLHRKAFLRASRPTTNMPLRPLHVPAEHNLNLSNPIS